MLFLPIIDSPNALEALVSAISEQEWLSSRGYSFSMFKREPKKKKRQQKGNNNVQLEKKEHAVRWPCPCVLLFWGTLEVQLELVGTAYSCGIQCKQTSRDSRYVPTAKS